VLSVYSRTLRLHRRVWRGGTVFCYLQTLSGTAAQQQDLEAIAGLRAETESRSRAIAEREAEVVAVTKEFNDDRDRFA
jgi:hypothetical protein